MEKSNQIYLKNSVFENFTINEIYQNTELFHFYNCHLEHSKKDKPFIPKILMMKNFVPNKHFIVYTNVNLLRTLTFIPHCVETILNKIWR